MKTIKKPFILLTFLCLALAFQNFIINNDNSIKTISKQKTANLRSLIRYNVTFPANATSAEIEAFSLPYFNDPLERREIGPSSGVHSEVWYLNDVFTFTQRPPCAGCVKIEKPTPIPNRPAPEMNIPINETIPTLRM